MSRIESCVIHWIQAWLQICCFAQDLIRDMLFQSYVIFLLKDQWMLERWSEAMGFRRRQLLANSIELFISYEKSLVVAARNLHRIKTFLTVELSKYHKSGSTFSSSEPIAATTCQQWLQPIRESLVFVLARSTRPSCAGVGRGLNLDSNLNSAAWPMGWRGFICSETPK